MSTGYGWEGKRQVGYVRRRSVRAMYLSASEVAVSTWGAITSVRPSLRLTSTRKLKELLYIIVLYILAYG